LGHPFFIVRHGKMTFMELEGKIAMVTGASSGIGRAITMLFLQQGAEVAGIARAEESLQAVAKNEPRFHAFASDLISEHERSHCVHRVIAQLGGIDILVHAAGIIASGSIETTTLSDWDTMMNINLRAVFHLTQLALPALIPRKGNIVVVSSVAGMRSFPGVLAYSVSKAAVDQFTRCTALELASKGVRVNAISPGVVVTKLHRTGGMTEEQYQVFLDRSTTTHPLGRVGQAGEIAELVLFLASNKASWITGVTYSIDGGRALTCAR
jgi:NAD(P)-dependent dehydrogenase (short-subunit alcohol dehydrogenase family)